MHLWAGLAEWQWGAWSAAVNVETSVPVLSNAKEWPAESTDAAAKAETHESDVAFDRWLQRSLHKLYGPVVEGKLPQDLAALLDRFESKAGKP